MWISLSFPIIPAIVSVLPALGRVTGFVQGVVLFIISLALSLVIMTTGWLFYRPVVAPIIIASAVLLVVLVMKRGKTKQTDAEL